jgi:hypothetical protein
LAAEDAVADESHPERGQQLFTREVEAITRRVEQRIGRHVQQQQAVLQARAQMMLEQAALIEIALGQQRSLFESESYPTSFSREAVKSLKRHKGVWPWLLIIATNKGTAPLPLPEATSPYYEQIRSDKPEVLKARFAQIVNEAEPLVQAWKRMAEV